MSTSETARETTSIEGGIEWFRVDEYSEDCMCARCGASAEYVPCWDCGDEGYTHHECGEDCCACRHPEPNVLCMTCGGQGGSWHCIASPEWCEANPIVGRAHIVSTALTANAWNDAP